MEDQLTAIDVTTVKGAQRQRALTTNAAALAATKLAASHLEAPPTIPIPDLPVYLAGTTANAALQSTIGPVVPVTHPAQPVVLPSEISAAVHRTIPIVTVPTRPGRSVMPRCILARQSKIAYSGMGHFSQALPFGGLSGLFMEGRSTGGVYFDVEVTSPELKEALDKEQKKVDAAEYGGGTTEKDSRKAAIEEIAENGQALLNKEEYDDKHKEVITKATCAAMRQIAPGTNITPNDPPGDWLWDWNMANNWDLKDAPEITEIDVPSVGGTIPLNVTVTAPGGAVIEPVDGGEFASTFEIDDEVDGVPEWIPGPNAGQDNVVQQIWQVDSSKAKTCDLLFVRFAIRRKGEGILWEKKALIHFN